MTSFAILILVIVLLGLAYVSHFNRIHEVRGEEQKEEVLHNFPFEWKGKKYWYSPSMAVAMFATCFDKNGVLHILANKRGEGCPDFNGCWNAPCGYLDFGETLKAAAIRETKEECGIVIPEDKVNWWTYEDSFKFNNNVVHRFIALLDGTIDDYQFNTSGMEENEVSDVAWIKLDDVDNYKWAFNHKELVKQVLSRNI